MITAITIMMTIVFVLVAMMLATAWAIEPNGPKDAQNRRMALAALGVLTVALAASVVAMWTVVLL